MKNFTEFYSKIEAIIESRSSKKEYGKGLLAPSKSAPTKAKDKNKDVHEKIADYIEAIRKQKKGMLGNE